MDDSSTVSKTKLLTDPPPGPTQPPAVGTPTAVGRYRIDGQIGAGGMGTVFKAYDPELRRTVAVKIPHVHNVTLDRPVVVQRFLREAHAAALVLHPNVCPIFDLGEADGIPFLVMPFVPGPTLGELLAKRGRRLEDDKATWLCVQIAEGLAAIHGNNLIHRDLKPGNILLQRSQAGNVVKVVPLITDFGLSRPERGMERLTSDGNIVGTPNYMSPEQAAGLNSQVDVRSDVYSLGVILYELLSGSTPFSGPVGLVIGLIQTQDPPPISRHRPDLTPAQVAIVHKALARNPDARYRTAGEFADDLRRWARQVTAKSPATPPSAEPTREAPLPPGAVASHTTVTALPAAAEAATVSHPPPAPPGPARPQSPTPQPETPLARVPRPTAKPGRVARRRSPYADHPPPPPPPGPTRRTLLISLLSSISLVAPLLYLLVTWLGRLFPSWSNNTPSGVGTYSPPPSGIQPPRTPLPGGGSDLMVLHMKEWAEKYSPVARASITYQRCGEGLAIDRMLRREFAFAGTVMPVSESQTKAEGVKLSDVVYVPVALGAIVPVFNVPGVSEALKLSPEVLAGIYTGTIRMWNDDAIRKANPDAKLPAANIVVMCRNDKSGSTYVWQDYLCSAAPDVFPQGIKGETPSNGWEWRGPPPLAQFADWSERPGFGVTLPNFSIAYLDLTTAGLSRLSVAQVKSANGDWMLADTTRIATAARNKLLGNDALEGLRFSLVNVPGQNSYPICTIFWVVALANQPKERGGELVKWFKWILGDGQSAVLDQKTATLPRELVGLIGPNLDRIAS